MKELVPIAICCVLPIMVVWLNSRRRIIENNSRTQIVLAAMDKNSDVDIEELLKKMTPYRKPKLLKEKLLNKLLGGSIALLLGIGVEISDICLGFVGGAPTALIWMLGCSGAILIVLGIAFLINYLVGKKMLAKEIEAELNQLTTKA